MKVTGRLPGWGLDIASVRRMVSDHGGKVSAKNEEGHGTTFTVHFRMLLRTQAAAHLI
jgi:signal transduction histidine kinase